MITANKPENDMSNYEKAPSGTHIARLYKIVSLGTQEVEWAGEMKQQEKIKFFWELPNEKMTYEKDGKEIESVFSVGQEFTLSMGDKSNLKPIVEGMIGTTLSDGEAWAFNMEELLGMETLLGVIHKKTKDGEREYAKVVSTSPLMKDQKCPDAVNPQIIFDAKTITEEELNELPSYLKEKIEVSPEYLKKDKNAVWNKNEPITPSSTPNEENSGLEYGEPPF